MANPKPQFTKDMSRRGQLQILLGQLINERQSFIPHWRDLGDYNLPRRTRFFVSDANKGNSRNSKIIDSTATRAAGTLRAGMVSGITPPSRPWFRLTTPDPRQAELGPVKEWLFQVTKSINDVYGRSNIYKVFPTNYSDLGVFGTGCMFIEEDFEQVIRAFPFPVGSYMLAQDHRLRVNVFLREFQMTVRQVVEKFGRQDGTGPIDWSKFSSHVRTLWERGLSESWVNICHCVKPNENYDPEKSIQSKFKKFASLYFENASLGHQGAQGPSATGSIDPDTLLSEKGYDFFPVLAPRWEVTGEDVYGTNCPGMITLGDVKQLQTMQKRKSQAVEKMINPPMQGPGTLKTVKTSILPGDMTYTDEREGVKGFRPVHEVNLRVSDITADIQDTRNSIEKGYHADLFLMLANLERKNITAFEVAERKEEALVALGPVLEQFNQDSLDPLTDITFGYLDRRGMIPPAPQELQGVPLKIEYIGFLAQAQKLVGVANIERFMNFTGAVAALAPSVIHKVNVDQVVDTYGDFMSIPPDLIRSDEEVAEIREQEAKAQQAAAQQEAIQMATQSAKNLSQANLEDDNALSRVVEQTGS